MIKNITVIGGSGFIGTRLCQRLEHKQYRFVIVDKARSNAFPDKTHIADVRSSDELDFSIPESHVLINLAAEHRDDVSPKSLYDQVNVEGAKNICTIARKKGIDKIIFISSVAIYGFAPVGTDESGSINYFNDYGRTKVLAEEVFKQWQSEDPRRSLVIVRPTVVFGENNRGNVYNLFNLIASKRFVMVGNGKNRKSMAYVENVAAFLEYAMNFCNGIHVYNYIDKPDFDMNSLVKLINKVMGKGKHNNIRIPYCIGYNLGKIIDLYSLFSKKKYSISSIRVQKFCSDSVFNSAISRTGFNPPVSLISGIETTIRYEFLDNS